MIRLYMSRRGGKCMRNSVYSYAVGVFNFSTTDHNGLDISAFEMLTVRKGKFAPLQK